MKENDKDKGVSKEEFDNNLKKIIFNVPPPEKDKRNKKMPHPFNVFIRFVPSSGSLITNKDILYQQKAFDIVQDATEGISVGKKLRIDGSVYVITSLELSQFQQSIDGSTHEASLDIYVQKSEDQSNP